MTMPPPTPVLDAIFREAQDYAAWWSNKSSWHPAILAFAYWTLFAAFFGGLRAFFTKTPPKTPNKNITAE